jgi:hypothetical protein
VQNEGYFQQLVTQDNTYPSGIKKKYELSAADNIYP